VFPYFWVNDIAGEQLINIDSTLDQQQHSLINTISKQVLILKDQERIRVRLNAKDGILLKCNVNWIHSFNVILEHVNHVFAFQFCVIRQQIVLSDVTWLMSLS
jgi:hypothetical protein